MIDKETLRENFIKWIDKELNERGWTFREFERRTGFNITNISNIRSKRRGVTWDFVAEVAYALNERPESVFRKVGLLPNHKVKIEELQEILDYLSDEKVDEILKYAEWQRKEFGRS